MPLRTASFTVRATAQQAVRWNRAASAAGHASVGTWLSEAADGYLHQLARAGRPVPLAWRRGIFRAQLEEGLTPVRGWVSDPFGIFRGSVVRGPGAAIESHVLVLAPTGRVLATVRYQKDAKALASDLARLWVRWDGSGGPEPPSQDPAPVLDRHRRESL